VRPRGEILAGLARRLRSVRYAVSDLAFVAGQALRRLGGSLAGAASRFWDGLSPDSRRRAPIALAAAALAAVALALLVPRLPCQLPGGDSCPPPDDAAKLVPADAIAYAHANLDPETEQYRLAASAAASTPLLSSQIVSRGLALVPGPGGAPPRFATEIAPWFGGELAVAVLAGRAGAATRVALLEASDPGAASRFGASIGSEPVRSRDYRGIEVATDRRGVTTAMVEGFLVIGSPDAVRALIDVATGAEGAEPLADDQVAEGLEERLPDQRLLEAYLSEEGAASLVAQRGTLRSFAPLVDPGVSRGAAAALTATEDGFELAVRSELDPERVISSPGFFAAFPPFEPRLPGLLGQGSLAYLGFADPGATVRSLLAQASAQAPGIAAGFERLVARMRREGGVDLERDLLDALGSEAAFAVGSSVAGASRPYLELVAAGVDEERARRALGALQAPLAAAVDPGSDLQAPVFGEAVVDGIEARTLRISPTVELTTAVFGGLAVIATDPAALAALGGDQPRLAESPRYQRATDGLGGGEPVSLAGYLDLAGLVSIGERLGLSEDPAYATFAAEFRRLDALGFTVAIADGALSTDARLVLSEPASAVAPPAAPPD